MGGFATFGRALLALAISRCFTPISHAGKRSFWLSWERDPLIKDLHDGDHVHYLDISKTFLTDNGQLTKDVMPDALHPNTHGYELWAKAMDAKVKELMPNDGHLHNWLDMAKARIKFQGLPARICWVGLGDRHRLGLAFNEMVARGELKAPIVIGRDHLDAGSVASPNRETEKMRDGSDAIADWPILNALINAVGGATWVSFHHGGGVGIGYSLHAGQVIVADGTPAAARRLKRVLTTDPGMGIARHVDAGYQRAIEVARERGVKIPLLED